jgi:hypothetical protein
VRLQDVCVDRAMELGILASLLELGNQTPRLVGVDHVEILRWDVVLSVWILSGERSLYCCKIVLVRIVVTMLVMWEACRAKIGRWPRPCSCVQCRQFVCM